ncbi:MAG: outer membrane protein W [Gammaproteobacteria bacterium]|jgi:outer membrane protein W
MKYFTLFTTLFLVQFTWTQSIYGSVSGGYQHIIQNSQPPSYIVNTYHQISIPWLWRQEDFSFTDATATELSFGHMLNEKIGYELTGAYLKPFDVNDNDEFTEREFSGQFFRMSAKIVLSVPIKKIDLYAKLGVNYAIGKLSYYQKFNYTGDLSLNYAESTLTYEYTNGSSLGYNLALGTNLNLNKRVSVFAEIYAIYQSFEPRTGRRTEQTANGVDILASADNPYFSEIQFGDESEWLYYNSEDKTQPQKLYKRNYSLGGLGIKVGIKFTLWEKKNEESVLPH